METTVLHQRITKPFGEDFDANNALADVLDLVRELAVESRKLTRPFSDRRIENAVRFKVRELHETICSRARSVFIAEDDFLRAACNQLGVQVFIPGIAPPAPRPDDELRRLEGDLIELEAREQDLLVKLNRARERFSDAQAATAAQRRAIDARRTALADAVLA